ncbi:MAG: zinc-binding dehydrogenase [Actinomycetota bacterium]|nr:zinc-binding dehydrogenase [Actinomycetota bacterium]
MAECKAAVVTGPSEPIAIWDVPVPPLEAGALLVRIDASTLCGTDVHRWKGDLADHGEPFITGHEPCGYVEEVAGEKVDLLGAPVRRGDRIVWSYVSCGHCYWCTVALQPCVCPGRMSWGHNPADRPPYLLGSCAEYMYVPPACQIVHVPEEVSSASAAAAACAYRTVMHGFDRLGALKSHETVAIQGSGPIGIFAAAVARDHGAKQVLVIGAPEHRLEVARRMGADATLDIDTVDDPDRRVEWVKDRTEGRGADVVLQAAGNAAVPEGLRMLRAGGRYVNIGAGGTGLLSVDTLPQEMSLFTVRSGEPRHWLQALDFLASRQGTYPFEELISRTYGLSEINEAMRAMAELEVIKAVIDPTR